MWSQSFLLLTWYEPSCLASGDIPLMPRTLAQLACQEFKKEPPRPFAAVLSPQYSIASPILQQLNFGRIIGDQVSLFGQAIILAVYLFFPSLWSIIAVSRLDTKLHLCCTVMLS